MSHYLFLPFLQVQGANALAGHFAVNNAPVMAVNLFAHNLGRKLGVFPRGVAILHHSSKMLGEENFRFNPQQRRGSVFIDKNDYPAGSHSLAIQPTANFHWEVSLVLELADTDPEPSLHAVERFLSAARIAGGQIVKFDPPSLLLDSQEVKNALHSGYWLIERPDLLAAAQHSSTPPLSTLAALVQVLGTKPVASNTQASTAETTATPDAELLDEILPDEAEEEEDWLAMPKAKAPEPLPTSWLVPTVLGYAAITTPTERSGSREGLAHAYAESLYGLVQYVSLRRFAPRPLPFWRMQWQNEAVFTVRCPDIAT